MTLELTYDAYLQHNLKMRLWSVIGIQVGAARAASAPITLPLPANAPILPHPATFVPSCRGDDDIDHVTWSLHHEHIGAQGMGLLLQFYRALRDIESPDPGDPRAQAFSVRATSECVAYWDHCVGFI
ncbi:hypothetical protein J6590_012826 [Homalodisca vitripennis]|nr:hypothetical protein J6590_012826 [Homalodisca vitripennis]